MNILFTSPTYYPHKGGAESGIEDLATAYTEAGHNVSIITSKSPPSLPAYECRNGVAIIRLKYPPQNVKKVMHVFLVCWRSFTALLKILSIIRKQKTDVVCLGLVGIDSFLVLVLSYFLTFKLIVYIHGGEIRSYVRISPLIRWTLKRCLRNCYAAIAVSEKLKNETIVFAPSVKNRIWVIPNGVDVAKTRTYEGYDHPRSYFLFAGRLHAVKGIGTLLSAFQQVSTRTPELDLIIVGTGPQEESLKRSAAMQGLGGRTIFLGAKERSDVYALIKGCEFLVLPSSTEGCPVVLLEAMAAGKMVIGSRADGITDIIEHEKNGVLFNPGDADVLAKLIFKYHTQSTTRARLEENVSRMTLTTYDIHQLYKKHLKVYAGFKQRLSIGVISLLYYHDESCSGLSSYHFDLCKSLSDLGHEVHLITLEENSAEASELENVLTVNMKRETLLEQKGGSASIRGVQRLLARLVFSFKAAMKVRKLDRLVGLDVVIAPELFGQGLFVSLLMRNKLITRIHTPSYIGDHYNERYRCQLIGRILSWPEMIQTRLSLGVTVASEHLASVIAKDWKMEKDRIYVIPNSVPTDWVRNLAAKQTKEISGEYLLYFGRLERRKGVHIISRALPAIFSKQPEIKMVFIGKDSGLKTEILRVNHQYQKNMIFFDTMEKKRLFGAIKYARLIILPSLFENLSLAGLEAMALGKPVIGTCGTAFEDTIEDGANGFLVPPGDPRALSEKVLSCLATADLDLVGQNAYKTSLRYDSRRIAEQNIEYYRKTLFRK